MLFGKLWRRKSESSYNCDNCGVPILYRYGMWFQNVWTDEFSREKCRPLCLICGEAIYKIWVDCGKKTYKKGQLVMDNSSDGKKAGDRIDNSLSCHNVKIAFEMMVLAEDFNGASTIAAQKMVK